MQQIYVDTSYFLRLLRKDNASQYAEAFSLFSRAENREVKLITSIVTVFEVIWLLRSVYLLEKTECYHYLLKILELKLTIENHDVIEYAAELWEKFSGSLEDCYHLAYAVQTKCGKLATFDKKLSKFSVGKLIEA